MTVHEAKGRDTIPEVSPEMVEAAARVMNGYLWYDYRLTKDDCEPMAREALIAALLVQVSAKQA